MYYFYHRQTTLRLCGVITVWNLRLNIHATRSVEILIEWRYLNKNFNRSCRVNIKSQVPNSNYTTQTEVGLPVLLLVSCLPRKLLSSGCVLI